MLLQTEVTWWFSLLLFIKCKKHLHETTLTNLGACDCCDWASLWGHSSHFIFDSLENMQEVTLTSFHLTWRRFIQFHWMRKSAYLHSVTWSFLQNWPIMYWESGQGDLQVQVIPVWGLVGALESRCTTQAKRVEETNMEAEALVPLLTDCPQHFRFSSSCDIDIPSQFLSSFEASCNSCVLFLGLFFLFFFSVYCDLRKMFQCLLLPVFLWPVANWENVQTTDCRILISKHHIWMPKRVWTISVNAICLRLVWKGRCCVDLSITTAGAILSLKTWLLMKLTPWGWRRLQNHVADATWSLPVDVLLNIDDFFCCEMPAVFACFLPFSSLSDKHEPYWNPTNESENGLESDDVLIWYWLKADCPALESFTPWWHSPPSPSFSLR